MSQTARRVLHELRSGLPVAGADVPRRDELRFRINRGPHPDVADAELALPFRGDVFLLGVCRTTSFIELQPLAGEVSERLSLKLGADAAHVDQQLGDRVSY